MRGVGLERVDLLADVAAVAEALRGGEAALQRRAVASRETTCGDSGAREEGGDRRENAHAIGGQMWPRFLHILIWACHEICKKNKKQKQNRCNKV